MGDSKICQIIARYDILNLLFFVTHLSLSKQQLLIDMYG